MCCRSRWLLDFRHGDLFVSCWRARRSHFGTVSRSSSLLKLNERRRSLVFAAQLSLLTCVPLACACGCDILLWLRTLSSSADTNTNANTNTNTSHVRSFVALPVMGALCGAFCGAYFLALDWEQQWQVWPNACVLGARLGFAGGAVASLIRWLAAQS